MNNTLFDSMSHALFTTFSYYVANWEGITGGLLFLLQAYILIRKIWRDR